MTKPRKAYCCGADFAHEPVQDIKFYETVKELKLQKKCWSECGILKLELKAIKIIKRGKPWHLKSK